MREWSVRETRAAVDGDGIGRTYARVRVTPESTGFPHTSWWRLDWRRDPGAPWRCTGIEPIDLGLLR